MASVRSCVPVKSAVSPVRYRSTRPGAAAGSGTLRVRSSSLALGGDGGCASSSGRGGGGLGLLGGDGPRIIRRGGGREVLAMCSASFDGVRPAAGAGAAVASAVQPVPAFPERAKVVALVAAIMLLCNADRVVMSVAVVPLAAQYGWSSSFVGIVQTAWWWSPLKPARSLCGAPKKNFVRGIVLAP
ncbi:probable anion transporter 2, chloroplastic isoform X2 [Miscanthus floridulus]|uniref:probable anion transporter 2, chloroplastic isoform X2 n=1 Tax=Miscanthus floridulus TaxID=154761 RepID=UPI003458E987